MIINKPNNIYDNSTLHFSSASASFSSSWLTTTSCFGVGTTTDVVAFSSLTSFTSFLSSIARVTSAFFSVVASLLADDEDFLSDLRSLLSRSRDFSFLAIMGVTRSLMVCITE